MPVYSFTVTDTASSTVSTAEADFETREAARRDAAATAGDLARGAFGGLAGNSEWRLDVRDEAGIRLFSFRLVAETA